jgi:IS5 family transposase
VDARWSEVDQKTAWGAVFPPSKHGKSHYGYKNHVNVDRQHKLVRRYHVSDAALHDSQAVDHLLMQGNTGAGVRADRQGCANGPSTPGDAYRSEETEAKLRARKRLSALRASRNGQKSRRP